MCLNPGLELFSTSGLRELSLAEDDILLHFLEKEDENFSGDPIWDMEKDRGMWFVEDDLQWSEVYPGNEVSRVSRDRKHECPPSKGSNLCRVVFTTIEEVLHSFRFITSVAGGICSHA